MISNGCVGKRRVSMATERFQKQVECISMSKFRKTVSTATGRFQKRFHSQRFLWQLLQIFLLAAERLKKRCQWVGNSMLKGWAERFRKRFRGRANGFENGVTDNRAVSLTVLIAARFQNGFVGNRTVSKTVLMATERFQKVG